MLDVEPAKGRRALPAGHVDDRDMKHDAHGRTASPVVSRVVVGGAVFAFFLAWFVANRTRLTATPDDTIRALVGVFFCLRILLRRKEEGPNVKSPGYGSVAEAAVGVLLVALGLVFRIRQFEWIGIVILAYACLRWALPETHRADMAWGLFFLYWMHPLPDRLLGPLHMFLQRMSVLGGEWLLHAVNVRVWADGLILRSAVRSFEVPQACSGLRTATTVLLCALGTGVLFRFCVKELLVFAVLGTAQGLALNIVRLSIMVGVAASKPPEWSADFLHDTTGVLLLMAVPLVHLEASVWSASLRRSWANRRARRRRGELWMATERNVMLRLVTMAAVVAAAAVVAGALYKRRPAHRAAMISEVVEGQMRANPEIAERAALAVVRLDPANEEYRLQRLRALLLRGKADAALAELGAAPFGRRRDDTVTLRAWALAMSGRIAEATSLLESLPEARRQHPLMAMAAAEIAVANEDADAAARHVAWAARLPVLRPSVRRLYPFLAARGRWKTISDAEHLVSHDREDLLHLAVDAHLRSGSVDRAAAALRSSRLPWRDDPRFLGMLLTLALNDRGGQWSSVFADTFYRVVPDLSVDDLYAYTEAGFRLQRPDVAWLAFARLRALAPAHPGLALIPARFAEKWFTFHANDLGVPIAGRERPNADVSCLFRFLDGLPGASGLVRGIPLMDQLGGEDARRARRERLAGCLETMRRFEWDAPDTPFSAWLAYVEALELAGTPAEALSALDRAEARYPDRASEVLTRRIRLHAARGDFERAYESLRRLRELAPYPAAAVETIMIDTLMRLDLGLYALHTATQARKRFPLHAEIAFATAAIWEAFGHGDEALWCLPERSGGRYEDVRTRLRNRTGRRSEAGLQRESDRDPTNPADEGVRPRRWTLPVAEQAVTWAPVGRSPDEGRGLALRLRAGVDGHASPFLRDLAQRTADFILEPAATNTAAAWRSVGRDPAESAVALHRLCLLQAERGARESALLTAREVAALLPECAIPWRILIALSGGDPGVVREARLHCPDDSEIWLADLVVTVRTGADPDAVLAFVSAAAETGFSVGAVVRAGEFLLRFGHTKAAAVVGRRAWDRDPSYLPACAVGMRCALAVGDEEWALRCAARGAELVPDPAPFLRTVARLRMDAGKIDEALTRHLSVLVDSFPEEQEWRERLGVAHFKRGETAQALSAFGPLVTTPERVEQPGILLVMAEALRQDLRIEEAAAVLEEARRRHPGNVHVLNNLVYTLAQTNRTLPQAAALLETLLALGSSPDIYDTVATAYLRGKEYDRARFFMDKAIRLLDGPSPQWREMHLHAAELHIEVGDYPGARNLLERGRLGDPEWRTFAGKRNTELLARIEKRMAERGDEPGRAPGVGREAARPPDGE